MATLEMAGPFEFVSKPRTMDVQAGKLVAAAGEEPADKAIESSVAAVPTPGATVADSEVLATKEEQIGRSRSRWAILAVAILALAGAGWVIHRKKATS